MHIISKEKPLARCSLWRQMLFQCFIASLILGPTAGLPRTALRQNPFEGLSLISEGQALMAKQTTQSLTAAIAKFKEGFALCQKNGNKGGMGAARLNEGIAYDSLGKSREALSAFLDAIRYFDESGFGLMNPVVFAVTGATYASLNEPDKALEYLNRALPSLRQANVPQFTAYALKGLGEVNVHLGQKRKALEYFNEALKLYRLAADWRHEIQVLVLISVLTASLGQSTEAIESARAAIMRAKENNAPDAEASGHFSSGAAYAAIGSLDEAATAYNQALQIFKEHPDNSREAVVLNNLGLIYNIRGELDLALDYFTRALRLWEKTEEPGFQAYALNNIGTLYSRRAEPLKAFSYFEKALTLAEKYKDRKLKAAILSSMADSYYLSNSPNYALSLFKESAAILAAIEEPGSEAEALINVADIYAALKRYPEALETLRPLFESGRIANDPVRHGYALREMGYIFTLMRDYGKAVTYYEEALSHMRSAGDLVGQVDLFTALGTVAFANGNYQKAKELFTQGLTLARTARLPRSESMILAGLGIVSEKQGNLVQAEIYYGQQIPINEALQSSAHIEELKTALGEIPAGLLRPAVLLKFKLGKWAEAFELAERSRARTFLDQMNGARLEPRKGADPVLVDQEQSLRLELRALEEKLKKERRDNPRSEASALMAASRNQKEEAYAALLIRLKASNPDYAELQSYVPKPMVEIQRLLGPQTTLISYYVTPEKMLAFVVGATSINVVEIPVLEGDLRAAINWFRDFASLQDPQPEGLTQLYGWLIAPIRRYIKTAEVIIVPHGPLHYVPFAALTDGRRFFGDERAITYLPSASILPALRRRIQHSGRRVLSVAQSLAPGLSALRYADEEARSVARLYGARPLLTGRATRAQFLKRAGAYNVLHIAAHAELNAASPLFSRILLAPGDGDSGAIEVREIYGLDLTRTNLVALSACETQLGAQSKGDDIVGLNRAFIYAGASSVIASLWTVDDEATSALMKSFYDHLRRGTSKAAALQAAQAATRKKHPHPYYWAAFVLTGDPGKDSGRHLTNSRALVARPK